MDVFLLRHADAEKRGANQDDGDRALTPKGEQQCAWVGDALKRQDVCFDLILFSPLLRAKLTAAIVARELDAKGKLKLSKHLAPSGDMSELIAEIRQQKVETVLLVGHEPVMSQLISTLLVGKPNLPLSLKKGGLCRLSVASLELGPCATLEWLIAPKLLKPRSSNSG